MLCFKRSQLLQEGRELTSEMTMRAPHRKLGPRRDPACRSRFRKAYHQTINTIHNLLIKKKKKKSWSLITKQKALKSARSKANARPYTNFSYSLITLPTVLSAFSITSIKNTYAKKSAACNILAKRRCFHHFHYQRTCVQVMLLPNLHPSHASTKPSFKTSETQAH